MLIIDVAAFDWSF